MGVSHLHLENFRAFLSANMDFPETGLVLIAGPNNAGKTALLSALDALVGDYGDLSSLRYDGAESPARLCATFDLDEAERAAILANAEGGQWLLDAGALSSLQFVFEQWQDQVLVLREVLGSWPRLDMQPVAAMRWKPERGGPESPYSFEVIRAFQAGDNHETQRAKVLDSVDQAHRLLEVTGTSSRGEAGLDGYLLSRDRLAPIMAPLTAWRSRFYHFRALRTGTRRSQEITSPDRLDPTGSNLAGVLHFLLTDRPPLFQQARDIIAQVVPDIGTLQIRTGGNQMRVVFESSTGELNLKDLGTGVEQLLMTVVVGLMEAPPLTLLIEEPETNLNPAAQRALLGLLRSWGRDRLVVAATHSAVMLDWSPAGDRLWLVTREHGRSNVAQVSADPLPLLSSLGVRLSDVLSADRVLVVEGASDEDILQVWFPQVLRNPRVAVLYGRGGENARHAGQLAEWLAGTDRIGLRQVLYLRDRDELASGKLERLNRTEAVHVLRRREIENYLLDPAAIASVIGPLVPPGSLVPDTAAIAQTLNSVAEKLRTKIIINRVAQQVIPPQSLMDNKLRKKLANDSVNLNDFINAVTGRLITPEQLKSRITEAWKEADADVGNHSGDKLLEIAPGEEILAALFSQYANRRYDKRVHGPAIAAAMSPPAELTKLFEAFIGD